MERRKFLKNTIIGGISLSLIPSIAFSASSQFKIIDIGEVNYQNRHGNLFNSNSFEINHSEFNSIKREVFFRNGTLESSKDAYQLKLSTSNKEYSFFITPANRNDVHYFDKFKLNYIDSNKVDVLKNDLVIPISGDSRGYFSLRTQTLEIDKPHVIISNS